MVRCVYTHYTIAALTIPSLLRSVIVEAYLAYPFPF